MNTWGMDERASECGNRKKMCSFPCKSQFLLGANHPFTFCADTALSMLSRKPSCTPVTTLKMPISRTGPQSIVHFPAVLFLRFKTVKCIGNWAALLKTTSYPRDTFCFISTGSHTPAAGVWDTQPWLTLATMQSTHLLFCQDERVFSSCGIALSAWLHHVRSHLLAHGIEE